MKACLNFSDLLEIGQPHITEMQRIGDSYADADVDGACIAFTRQVRMVEGAVVQTYGVAALLARREEDLNEVAEIWIRMSSFCKSALTVLSVLRHKYPLCGTPELYDLVLDYKLACEKRYTGAMEELACQSTSFPKGLLPEMT